MATTSKNRAFIEEDPDSSDTISVTSTALSETRSEYAVEAIIGEAFFPDVKCMKYLVKWEGYPLNRCTWEPADSFDDNISSLEAFHSNTEAHAKSHHTALAEIEERENAKKDRDHRRAGKRRKLAQSKSKAEVSSDDEGPLASLQERQTNKTKAKAAAAPTTQRKGIAKKVIRPGFIPEDASESSAPEIELGSDVDCLFGEPNKAEPSTVARSTFVPSTSTPPMSAPPTFAPPTSEPLKQDSARISVATQSRESRSASTESSKVAPRTAAPPQKAIPKARKPADSSVFAHWTKPTKRGDRRRKQEPDPDVLGTVNPKTGIREPPKIQSAYSRRATPPPAAPEPKSPAESTPASVSVPNAAVRADARPDQIRRWTCRYWLEGNCKFTPHTCQFAHWVIPIGKPKINQTCRFWARGFCKKADAECEFMHHETGVIAEVPTWVKLQKNFSKAPASALNLPPAPVPAPKVRKLQQEAQPPAQQPVPSTVIPRQEVKADHELDQLFKGNKGTILDKHVCIWFHPENAAEIQSLWDRLRAYGCKIYKGTVQRQYVEFQEKYGARGVLIFHSEWNTFHEIRDFRKILDGTANIWSIGKNQGHALQMGYVFQPEVTSIVRLFPYGRLIFITDDVFEHFPDKGSQIILQFLKDNEVKPLGERFDKIVTRPGVWDWILALQSRKLEEQGDKPTDGRWYALALDFQRMFPNKDMDPTDLPTPKPHSFLMSGSTNGSSFDAFEALEGDAALEWITNWFAGMINFFKQYQFRRFTIIHQPKDGSDFADQKGWAKRYEFLDVKTPDQWLQNRKAKK